MSAKSAALTLAYALLLTASSCSSSAEPVITVAPPSLTTVPPLDPSVVPVTRPPPTSAAPEPTPSPTTAPFGAPRPGVARFIPTIPLVDGRLVLNVEFVDGTTAMVSWPSSIDLTSEGLVPYGWAFISGGAARNFFIRPGTIEDVLALLGRAELLDEYPAGNGQLIGLWRPIADEVDYLAFQFGDWTVLVYDYRTGPRMTDEHKALWATNFHGEETGTGFLRLSADRPLELVYAGDYPDPLSMTLHGAVGQATLVPGTCEPGTLSVSGDGDGYASWCTEAGDMAVYAYGPTDFQRAVETGLSVEAVEIAVPPPPPEDEEES